MRTDFLIQNWALFAAAVLGTVVTLFVLFRVFQESRRGRLQACARELRRSRARLRKASHTSARTATRLERLQARSDSVPPRRLQEATDARDDALALEKIASDQLLIAKNQLRKLIVEEFPPRRQAVLRSRYLADDEPDNKPFTF